MNILYPHILISSLAGVSRLLLQSSFAKGLSEQELFELGERFSELMDDSGLSDLLDAGVGARFFTDLGLQKIERVLQAERTFNAIPNGEDIQMQSHVILDYVTYCVVAIESLADGDGLRTNQNAAVNLTQSVDLGSNRSLTVDNGLVCLHAGDSVVESFDFTGMRPILGIDVLERDVMIYAGCASMILIRDLVSS